MAIITKPSTINKGSPSQITLSKSELKVHSAITDAYFQDDENWKTVSVNYKNAEGQEKIVVFDASQANPSRPFVTTDKVRSNFEVQSVTIYDFDGGVLTVKRSELSSGEQAALDISFGKVFAPVFFEFLSSNDLSQANNELIKNANITSVFAIDQDDLEDGSEEISVKYVVKEFTDGVDFLFGVTDGTTSYTGGPVQNLHIVYASSSGSRFFHLKSGNNFIGNPYYADLAVDDEVKIVKKSSTVEMWVNGVLRQTASHSVSFMASYPFVANGGNSAGRGAFRVAVTR